MPVTLALDPATGDIDVRTGGLTVLSGPSATAQNIDLSLRTERGTWPLNVRTVGFPLSTVLLAVALLDAANAEIAHVATIARDHLRTPGGQVGVTGVREVIGTPVVAVVTDDLGTPTLEVEGTVLDDSSEQVQFEGVVLTGGGA